MGLAGPNCWPGLLANFASAVVASTAFRTMVELPAGPDLAVAAFVFGNRVTHAHSGRVWTKDELQELRHYAAVLDDPDRPYGKHRDPLTGSVYKAHGTSIVALASLILEANLVD